MEVVQITRYELISFINTTKIIMNGIKEELRGLRLTALQNRIVLDQFLAARSLCDGGRNVLHLYSRKL